MEVWALLMPSVAVIDAAEVELTTGPRSATHFGRLCSRRPGAPDRTSARQGGISEQLQSRSE